MIKEFFVPEPVIVSVLKSNMALTLRMLSYCSDFNISDSIIPLLFSKTQSPPKALFPVVSSDAATSACVKVAIEFINSCPVPSLATLHPYNKISPSTESEFFIVSNS